VDARDKPGHDERICAAGYGVRRSALCLQRRHALDFDQHLRIGQRLHHARRPRRIGRRPERFRVKLVHGRDVGRAGQQHIELDHIAERRARLIQHALDVDNDIAELRLEAVRQRAVGVEAGNARDEQEVADTGGKGERWGFDAGGGREVLDGHGGPLD
jgi:hypothetical protein